MVSAARRANPGPRAAASAQRREAILAAALELFLAHGVRAVTIDELRERSGASVGSIYHHFGSKEGVAAALYVDGMRDYQHGFLRELEANASARGAVEGAVAYHLAWVERHRELARFLLHHREPELVLATAAPLHAANREFFAAVRAWLAEQSARGALRKLASELYYPLWIAPAQEFSRQALLDGADVQIAAAAPTLGGAAWLALKPQGGNK